MKVVNSNLNLKLHNKQGIALTSAATEIGYGGAAGGGKSHLGRVSAIIYASCIPGLQVYLFRRQHNELVKNHMEGPTGFSMMLHPWTSLGIAKIVKDEIRFWNGSKIFLCHCQHEKDVYNWLGPEMHYLIIEQAEQFSPFMIQMLRGRTRMPDNLIIPDTFKKAYPDVKFPRILYTFNPGGVGHGFFKSLFVKARKPYEIERMVDEQGGKLRQFIPAKLDDNPSVNPVEYRSTLKGLPPKLAKALEEGDFDQVIGAFFPEINPKLHLITPFEIPSNWTKFMAMDWGACGEGDPFSIGWWAISDGSIPLFPRHSLVCYRSWYGQGLPKITVSQVSAGIHLREAKDGRIVYRVAGGDIDQKRGSGPSIYEIFYNEGIAFKKADQRRKAGAQQLRERLTGKQGVPAIYWFDDQHIELETVLGLQHDLNDPNDCIGVNDHVYDQVRYAIMSRPWGKTPVADITLNTFDKMTYNDLLEYDRLYRDDDD